MVMVMKMKMVVVVASFNLLPIKSRITFIILLLTDKVLRGQPLLSLLVYGFVPSLLFSSPHLSAPVLSSFCCSLLLCLYHQQQN